MSIGFSKMVSIAFIVFTAEVWLSAVRGRSLRDSVMSASGVPWNCEGSGDAEVSGVGNEGGSSGVAEARAARTGALFRLRGEAFFDGDSGSGIAVWSGSNISEGSMFSFARLFFARPPVRGVFAIEFVVLRLDWGAFRGLRLGAGVKSSSLSTSILDCICSSSPSDSTTTFLRAAARLEGLTGDSDILMVWRTRLGSIYSSLLENTGETRSWVGESKESAASKSPRSHQLSKIVL
jgi:hypothetical protein